RGKQSTYQIGGIVSARVSNIKTNSDSFTRVHLCVGRGAAFGHDRETVGDKFIVENRTDPYDISQEGVNRIAQTNCKGLIWFVGRVSDHWNFDRFICLAGCEGQDSERREVILAGNSCDIRGAVGYSHCLGTGIGQAHIENSYALPGVTFKQGSIRNAERRVEY